MFSGKETGEFIGGKTSLQTEAYENGLKDEELYYNIKDDLGLISRGNVYLDKTAQTIFSELSIAIDKGNLEPLKNFLKNNKLQHKKADINAKNGYGDTPLCYAAEKNNFEVAKILIKYGADLTIHNAKGETPIELFSQYGNREAVNYLQNCLDILGNNSLYEDTI